MQFEVNFMNFMPGRVQTDQRVMALFSGLKTRCALIRQPPPITILLVRLYNACGISCRAYKSFVVEKLAVQFIRVRFSRGFAPMQNEQ